jgi:hypothetical protein
MDTDRWVEFQQLFKLKNDEGQDPKKETQDHLGFAFS